MSAIRPRGSLSSYRRLGARLIELLAAGSTVAEAATQLEHELGEPVDVVDFVEMLVEAGLLDEREAIGETAAEEQSAEPGKKVKYWVVSEIPAVGGETAVRQGRLDLLRRLPGHVARDVRSPTVRCCPATRTPSW